MSTARDVYAFIATRDSIQLRRATPMAPTPESIESLKHAPGVAGMVEPILNRWSPRAYADRDVSAEDLKKGFEAARWAASSSNEQPWRFLVGRRGDETFKKILDALVP